MVSEIRRTLPGVAYHSEETYTVDTERVFYRNWVYAGRAERVASPGAWLRVEIAGESILLVRGKDEQIRAFYNVCRHRGSRICDDEQGFARTHLRCPYHAWGYALDGSLVTTPMIEKDEIDRESTSLWPVHVDVWEGFVFVNLSREEPRPLLEHLADQMDDPLALAKYGLADLRIAHITTNEVQANWKIVLENYNECLHCPSVHPELVSIVPIYRKGEVIEKEGWFGNTLIEGGTSFTFDGHSKLPPLPGIDDIDRHAYYGFALFPTLLINYHSDCVMTYQLWPVSPDRTIVVSEFLFMPETIESADFDPSEVVDFWDLVSRQDWVICERAHLGTRSKAYTSGVFPKQDGLLHEFTERYLKVRGPAPAKR